MQDSKVFEFSLWTGPFYLQVSNNGPWRTFATEVYQTFKSAFLTLDNKLDSPVMEISDPARKFPAFRQVRDCFSVKDTLNSASYKDLNAGFEDCSASN